MARYNINRLSRDELEYELTERGIDTSSSDVQDMRKKLRHILKLEKDGTVAKLNYSGREAREELVVLDTKLKAIQESLKNKEQPPHPEQIHTKLTHIYNRALRLKTEEQELLNERSTILQASLDCWDLIRDEDQEETSLEEMEKLRLSKPSTSKGGGVNSNYASVQEGERQQNKIENHKSQDRRTTNMEDQSSSSSSEEANATKKEALKVQKLKMVVVRANRQRSPNSYAEASDQHHIHRSRDDRSESSYETASENEDILHHRRKTITIKKSVNVKDWDCRFSGDGTGQSINAFLENISAIRRARNTSRRDLFRQAIDLFEGPALSWYKSIRRDVDSWDEIVNLLREEFEPEDYEDRLWEEIRNRTQGREEKVGAFIVTMKNYFARLPNLPSEKKMLKQIQKNLTPFFQERLALESVKTIEQLRKLCKQIESCRERVNNYRPPPRDNPECMERDLAYNHPKDVKKSSHNENKIVNAKCWNCQTYGHRFKSCQEAQKKFCHRCGQSGKPTKECNKCNPGNEGLRRK